MFASVLPQKTQRALATLAKLEIIQKSYLAGGSALALQLGHRESLDLDFFTPEKFEEKPTLQQIQAALPSFKSERTAWRTVLGSLDKVQFSLFYYKYPLIKPTKKFKGVNLASLEDIAASKINAVSDRGLRRDFIDLYILMKKFTLPKMLKFYDQRFKNLNDQLPHILRSLVYFDDAEGDISPKLFHEMKWSAVKNTITDAVLQYRKQLTERPHG